MKTAHLEVDVQSDVCPPDSPGGTQNEEGDENRSSNAGIGGKLVTWLTLTAFVVAAVAVTALAGSSVPSTLLREHPRSESEGRELGKYRGMSIWMDNVDGGKYKTWDMSLGMVSEGKFTLRDYRNFYVSYASVGWQKRHLNFEAHSLRASDGKQTLIHFDIDTNAGAVYNLRVQKGFGDVGGTVVVYISTFSDVRPVCPLSTNCNCAYDTAHTFDQLSWVCELDLAKQGYSTIKVTAV